MSTTKLNPLALLQICHVGLLLLAAILYGSYYSVTDAQDYFRTRFDILVIVSGASIPVAGLLYSLIFGVAEDFRKKLIGTYRRLLSGKPFLLISNVFLFAVCGFLLHLVLSYRNVTVAVSESANLYLNDAVGSVDFIGEWKSGQSRTVRMRVGHHLLVAKEQSTNSPTASLQIDVRPPWQACTCDYVTVNARADPFRPVGR